MLGRPPCAGGIRCCRWRGCDGTAPCGGCTSCRRWCARRPQRGCGRSTPASPRPTRGRDQHQPSASGGGPSKAQMATEPPFSRPPPPARCGCRARASAATVRRSSVISASPPRRRGAARGRSSALIPGVGGDPERGPDRRREHEGAGVIVHAVQRHDHRPGLALRRRPHRHRQARAVEGDQRVRLQPRSDEVAVGFARGLHQRRAAGKQQRKPERTPVVLVARRGSPCFAVLGVAPDLARISQT